MHQVLFEIPGLGLSLHSFSLMLFLAVLAAMNLAAWRARKSGIDPNLIFDLALWVILGGLIGARLFYVVQHKETIETFLDIFKVWRGGIVLYGSLIGATVGYCLFWTIRRFPIWQVADVVAPAMALGVAIGRMGCFLNGCCFGDVCDPSHVPWAVQFPTQSLPWFHQIQEGLIAPDALRSLPVHPTQLYSVIDGLLLMGLLLAFYPLRRRDGQVLAFLLIAYAVSRFLIEQLRDDEGAMLAGLTISQAISLFTFSLGLLLWLLAPRRATLDTEADAANPVVTPAAT